MSGTDERPPVSEELERTESDATRVVDLHEPIYREKAEPEDGYEPTPMWLLFVCLALMGFGGWYLGMYSGGFDPTVYDERSGRSRAAAAVAPEVVDPMVLGKRVYNNCMACHQRDGTGVAGNYPPLAGSLWVTGREDVLTELVLHGIEGPITVLGEQYNQVMPPWRHLGDEQVAAVLTYIRASFGNDADPVTPELVTVVRGRGDRSRPWSVAELDEYAAEHEVPVVTEAAVGGGSGEAEG